jgi:membrane associated rhomboid family serine protease
MDEIVRLSAGAPASALLLATIVVVSAAGLFRWPALIERNLLRPHGLVQRGDYHTLVTSGFIHADVAHLLFNGFTFWAFGFDLERRLGTASFVALYLAGLLASSIATWLIHRGQPAYASLGASGAILAVLFASIVAVPTASIFILPIPVPIRRRSSPSSISATA